MNKIKLYVKREMDVEFLACVHGMSLVMIFSFESYLCGVRQMPCVYILQMLILGYVMSWFQKLLFLKERKYGKGEYLLRSCLWVMGPIAMMCVCAYLFHWMEGLSAWVMPVFIILMMAYYTMILTAFRVVYEDDTRNLNTMLAKWKEEKRDAE